MQRYSGRISKSTLKRKALLESEEIFTDRNYSHKLKKRILFEKQSKIPDSFTFISEFAINGLDEKSTYIFNMIKQSYKQYLNYVVKKETESIEEFRNYLIILKITHQDSEYHFEVVKNHIVNNCKLGINDINIMIKSIQNCIDELYKYSFLGKEFFEHTITNFKKDLICAEFIRDKINHDKHEYNEDNYLQVSNYFIQNQKNAQNVLTHIITACDNFL